MMDNLIAILVIIALIWFILMFIYRIYLSLKADSGALSSDENEVDFSENELNSFKYFLNKVLVSYEELEQERSLLLKFLERNSESLKQLGDAYEQLELYLEFKLTNVPEDKQERLRFHYQKVKVLLAEKFEELLNQHLSMKMTYSPYFEENTQNKPPIRLDDMGLNFSLFRLKKQKLKK